MDILQFLLYSLMLTNASWAYSEVVLRVQSWNPTRN